MSRNYPFDELRKLLTSAQSIYVLLPSSVNFDQVSSALSLYLALAKSGKQVSVLAPEEMTVEFSHLVGVDKVGNKAAGGELVLTINAPIENVEKVSSSEEDGKLNLTIRPKPGATPLKQEDIIFSSVGGNADLLFLVEPKKLENLGKIYQENQSLFTEKPLVNISHFPRAEKLGQINIIDASASSCSEIIVGLIEGLGLLTDSDICGNLLLGLKNATGNFQSSAVTAQTFGAAAFCLRQGAGGQPLPLSGNEEDGSTDEPPTPSDDWFEPKIYKGSTLP